MTVMSEYSADLARLEQALGVLATFSDAALHAGNTRAATIIADAHNRLDHEVDVMRRQHQDTAVKEKAMPGTLQKSGATDIRLSPQRHTPTRQKGFHEDAHNFSTVA